MLISKLICTTTAVSAVDMTSITSNCYTTNAIFRKTYTEIRVRCESPTCLKVVSPPTHVPLDLVQAQDVQRHSSPTVCPQRPSTSRTGTDRRIAGGRRCQRNPLGTIQKICEDVWSDSTQDALTFLRTIGVTGNVYKHYQISLGVAPGQTQSYAKTSYLSEQKAGSHFDPDDFFLPLCKVVVEERASALSGLNMDKRIKEKLVSGGYGQFEARYIMQLSLSAKVKKQLTIGWKPERPDDDDDE